MEIWNVAVLTIAAFGRLGSISAWDCDKKCWNYDECKDDRRLENGQQEHKSLEEVDDKPLEGEPKMIHVDAQEARLRGGRKLDDSSYYFNLKMFHDDGFCWQGEYEDRR